MKTSSNYVPAVLVQSFSALTSLLSLSWSLVSYQKTLRYAIPDKPQLSVGGAATLFLWHTGQVTARVMALALFANAFKMHVFILLAAHWALMTSWILGQVRTVVRHGYQDFITHEKKIERDREPTFVLVRTANGGPARSSFTTSLLVGSLLS